MPLGPGDVAGRYAGLRPLAAAATDAETADLSRRHAIVEDPDGGALAIVGGKLTTYRRMAQDAVDRITDRPCRTHAAAAGRRRRAGGAALGRRARAARAPLRHRGAGGRRARRRPPGAARAARARRAACGAELLWAVRHELALTPDDLVDRRTRAGLVPGVARRRGDWSRGGERSLGGSDELRLGRERGERRVARALPRLPTAAIPRHRGGTASSSSPPTRTSPASGSATRSREPRAHRIAARRLRGHRLDPRRLVVAGPATGPVIADLPAGRRRSACASASAPPAPRSGFPAAELLDATVPLADVWDAEARRSQEAAATGGAARRSRQQVGARIARGEPDRAVRAAATGAPSSGIGDRQLRRRFADAVGYGPKTLQRILRFQRFLVLARAHAGARPRAARARGRLRRPGAPDARVRAPRRPPAGRAAGVRRRARRREVRFVQDARARAATMAA